MEEDGDIIPEPTRASDIVLSTSGARIEIDRNGWRTYDSAWRERISINANDSYGMNAISFAKSNGGGTGTINGGDTVF